MKRVSTILPGAFLMSALVFSTPALAAPHDLVGAPAHVVAVARPYAGARPAIGPAVLYGDSSDRAVLLPVDARAAGRGPATEARGDRDFDNRSFVGGFGFRGFYNPFAWDFGWGPSAYGYWWPGYYGLNNGYYGYYYTGGLKLKITGPNPKRADVFENGSYVGTVDDFNGTFQQLTLRPGAYDFELRARGFRPLTFKVRIQPDKTITYRGQMQSVS